MAPVTTARRPYHHGDLRAALLTRAEQALEETGPGALSLRGLARDLGVSPGAPSRNYSSKKALLDALALEGFESLRALLAAAQDGAGEPFADRLTALSRAYLGFAAANPALLDLMYSVKYDPTASPDLAAASQRLPALAARPWRGRGPAQINASAVMGSSRTRRPVALKTALAMAGATPT